jgi:hypothetical protein
VIDTDFHENFSNERRDTLEKLVCLSLKVAFIIDRTPPILHDFRS